MRPPLHKIPRFARIDGLGVQKIPTGDLASAGIEVRVCGTSLLSAWERPACACL